MALPSGHRPQLDALRAVAVALVALQHWEDVTIAGHDPQLGFLGVGLFLVLSGYLITGILLGVNRDRLAVEPAIGVARPITAFYIRRFLRLFPAYYFFLFTTWATGIVTWDDGLGWYLAYAANVRIALGGWDIPVAHLWSLAVEEQFYLLAAPAVLGLRRPRLVAAFVAVIVIGLYPLPQTAVVPPGAFVGLVVGCLLAVVAERHPRWADRLGRVWPIMFVVWVVVYASVDTMLDESRAAHAAFRLLAFVAMAGLIWRAAVGTTGFAGRALEWRPLVWLGTISYGLYLWHTVVKDVLVYAGFDYDTAPVVFRLTVTAAATIAVATLSWRVVERPFLDLKRHHPYLRPPVAGPGRSSTKQGWPVDTGAH